MVKDVELGSTVREHAGNLLAYRTNETSAEFQSKNAIKSVWGE